MSPKSLQERRKALGMSQQALAVAAGCSFSRVGQLEREMRPPTSEVLERIEAVLSAGERGLSVVPRVHSHIDLEADGFGPDSAPSAPEAA